MNKSNTVNDKRIKAKSQPSCGDLGSVRKPLKSRKGLIGLSVTMKLMQMRLFTCILHVLGDLRQFDTIYG